MVFNFDVRGIWRRTPLFYVTVLATSCIKGLTTPLVEPLLRVHTTQSVTPTVVPATALHRMSKKPFVSLTTIKRDNC